MIKYIYISPHDETGDTIYTYDRMGGLTRTDDSEGNTVSYTYDEAGNVSGITYPDGGVISYKYDKNNNIISVRDATGNYPKPGNKNQSSEATETVVFNDGEISK